MSVTATDYSGQVWLSLFNDTVRTYTFQLIFYHLLSFLLCSFIFSVFRIILIFIVITLLCYYDYFDFFLLNISWFSSFLISQFLTFFMSIFELFYVNFRPFSCRFFHFDFIFHLFHFDIIFHFFHVDIIFRKLYPPLHRLSKSLADTQRISCTTWKYQEMNSSTNRYVLMPYSKPIYSE